MPIRLRDIGTSLQPSVSASSIDEKKRIHIPNLRDRFATLAFISWWERDKVANAKVMVVGAGALGNEVLKNLALMGVGHIIVVDMDIIEMANLSRSILYREHDEGRLKAEVAAERVREISPSASVHAIPASIITGVGLGLIRQMDVVIGCLDNRLARWYINHYCYLLNIPWIDAGIAPLEGQMSIYDPRHKDRPCYNCTLSPQARSMMRKRLSCQLIARRNATLGKSPTTSITASIFGAMQVQEALKLIHGMPTQAGIEYRYSGFDNTLEGSDRRRQPHCNEHESFDPAEIVTIDAATHEVTIREVKEALSDYFQSALAIRLDHDLVIGARCGNCGFERRLYKLLPDIKPSDHLCPNCGSDEKFIVDELNDITVHITDQHDFLDRTFSEIGVPPYAILRVTLPNGIIAPFEFVGDHKRYFAS